MAVNAVFAWGRVRWPQTYCRYMLASGVALAFDTVGFLVLLSSGVAAAPASAWAYALGIVVHWGVSSRYVFNADVRPVGLARTRQQGLFVLTAMLGLGLTTTIVAVWVGWGHDPRMAKLIAVLVGFHITYLARRLGVFRSR